MSKQESNHRWVVVLCLGIVGTVGLVSGCSKKSSSTNQNEILVGEVEPMTGSQATFGNASHQGIELAVRSINAAGGVHGKKIRLITIDDQSKSEEAAIAVTKLITQDRVVAILGEIASSRSLAMGPIAQDQHVPMVSPGSTNAQLTEVGNYVFRTCFIDPFQGRVMARFISQNLKMKQIAVLKDVKSDYSVGLSEAFENSYKMGGGSILIQQSYSSGDIDFKSQLTTIRSKHPEGIFIPGSYTEVGLIARQARELGIQVPLLGGDSWDSPRLLEIGGNALVGSYFSNHYSEDDKTPRVQDFILKFKEAFGTIPDGLAALGYDGAQVLVDAMKRAKTLSPQDIRDALATTRNFPGINGTISLDDHRNAIKPAVIIKIENGHFRYQTTVLP